MSSKLTVLGAAYGLKNVTQQVQTIVDTNGSGDSLHVMASNDVFGDTWPGVNKSLVVVYQYPGYNSRTSVVKEGQEMTIVKPPGAQEEQSFAQAQAGLVVLGAAYGAGDVTQATRKLVSGTKLEITAENDTFYDTWKGVTKSFVGVFQSAGMIIVKEATYFSLATPIEE